MKTIEEMKGKRSGYFPVTEHSEQQAYERGFTNGVEFAQRWIPVSEELPESGETVFVKLSNNEHRLAFINIYRQFIISLLNNYESEFITHWRPIERI